MKRHHEEIRFHLMIRVDRLRARLAGEPSFCPVGSQEVRDFAQWQIDNGLTKSGDHDFQEIVMASFTGELPAFTVWHVCNVKLKQI